MRKTLTSHDERHEARHLRRQLRCVIIGLPIENTSGRYAYRMRLLTWATLQNLEGLVKQ